MIASLVAKAIGMDLPVSESAHLVPKQPDIVSHDSFESGQELDMTVNKVCFLMPDGLLATCAVKVWSDPSLIALP